MFYTGAGAVLQFGKEATFGTGVTPTALIDLTSESLKVSVEKGDEGSLLASKTAMSRDLLGINVDGSISGILRPEMAGMLLQAVMGGTDTVTSADDKYKHSIVLGGANAAMPSLTLVMDRHVDIKKYAGCTVSALTIEAAAADYVKFTADIVGTNEATGTLATGLTMTVPAYRCTSASFKVNNTVFDIQTATLRIDNALEQAAKTYSSGLYRGQPQHGQRAVTISFEIPFNSDYETFKNTYLTTETNAAIVLEFASTDTDYSFKVTLPNVAITDASANISGTGAIGASAEGTALTVGTTEPITVEIVDDNSSAYSA